MSTKLQTLSPKALVKIKDNNVVVGRLMALFDVREITIQRWIEANDFKLANPASVKIIMQETHLKESEILADSE